MDRDGSDALRRIFTEGLSKMREDLLDALHSELPQITEDRLSKLERGRDCFHPDQYATILELIDMYRAFRNTN
jgi:hypothetical protein